MFLRKLLGSNNEKKKDAENAPPAGVQAMGVSLQRKFAKGVQYNMKLIIKGDRNVGKTCLYQRLQGQKFKEEYLPTDEIQVASIQWNYKATDDVVKVEVWDVVDKGKKKKKIEGLKLTAEDDAYEDACLDAEFIDVYKGTHGVIMVMDITKQWTFDYIEREMAKVPSGLPVLLLANHRDMGHHRTVTEDKVRYYIEELQRGPDAGPVRYAEASMRNGFGLKYIHKFFNLPFLRLQRETLLKQLETNSREIELTNEELDVHEDSEEQDYDLFLNALTDKRREQAEKLAEDALKEARTRQEEERAVAIAAAEAEAKKNAKSLPNTPATTPSAPPAKPHPGLAEAPPAKPIPGLQLPLSTSSTTITTTGGARSSTPSPTTTMPSAGTVSAPATPSNPSAPPITAPEAKASGGLMSRWFGKGNGAAKNKEKEEEEQAAASQDSPVFPAANVMKSIEDFRPEEGLDAGFLEDLKESKPTTTQEDSSSDEETGHNPMVAGFQDELDSEDDVAATAPVTIATEDITSDEDEDLNSEAPAPVITKDADYESEKVDVPKIADAQKRSPSPSPLVKAKLPTSQQNAENNVNGGGNAVPRVTILDAAKMASAVVSDSEDDDDSDSAEGGGVQVLEDVEDVSDLDEGSGGQVVAVIEDDIDEEDIKAKDSDEEEEKEAPVSALQFEDLSILEKGFDFSTGLQRPASVGSDLVSSSRQDTDTDNDNTNSSKKKKKKHKEKDKVDGEKSSSKKKKKHRDREKESPVNGEDKEKKKKKKSKKREEEKKKEMDELEAFLGGGGDNMIPGGGEGYESL